MPALAEHLSKKIASRFKYGPVRISDEFLRKLQFHTWPGNIRELENAIERAVIRTGGTGLLSGDLVDLRSHPVPKAEVKPPEVKPLRESEKDLIVWALASNNGNVKKTSVDLGIARNTLYRKMMAYGITP